MSDPKDQLKTMLQDLINDRPEQATVTIHDYIVAKTQQLAGLSQAVPEMDLPAVDGDQE